MINKILLTLSIFILGSTGVKSQSHEGYITAGDNLRLFYRTVGEGTESIIIALTSGWGIESFERLAQNRRVIFFDPRNRGRSDTVRNISQIGIDYDIQNLEAVRQFFKLKKISLIGWSYYGGVVARYAVKYPDRVSRMIQVGPIAPALNIQDQKDKGDEVVPSDSGSIRKLDEMLKAGMDGQRRLRKLVFNFCHSYKMEASYE